MKKKKSNNEFKEDNNLELYTNTLEKSSNIKKLNRTNQNVEAQMSIEKTEAVQFKDSNICEEIKRAVSELGFENMTPIQEKAIPVLMSGVDVLGQAQTGTGKTAAFGIPVIENIKKYVEEELVTGNYEGVKAIILCPTRELAIQAAEEIRSFAKYTQGMKVLPIYGGQDITRQIRSLKEHVQIVVGTPGRIMDHMRRRTLKLNAVKMLVLDEADEMLNMGFREDIETICQKLPENIQTAFFSATMPKSILEITHKYQNHAVMLKMPAKEVTIPLVKQYYYEVKQQNKDDVVCRLIDFYSPERTLIFCNTKRKVDELTEVLKGWGYEAEGLHGDLSQGQRDMVMNRFRNGNADILIATDVAARGIDVDNVEAVINYDVPQDIEYYVHRIGRSGRAGKKGRAFTLVVGREIYKIRDIERSCKTKMKARVVPSAADVTNLNADKYLSQAFEVIKKENLDNMLSIIEGRLNEEDCTAMELAAAFLKIQMGEELVDIPTENYFRDKQRKNKNRNNQEDKSRHVKKKKDFSAKKFSKNVQKKPQKKSRNNSKKNAKKNSKKTSKRTDKN